MHIPDIGFHEADTLEEASRLLERYGESARLLAGGTDLLVDLKTGRVEAGHLVSLRRVGGLRGVTLDAGSLRIGALTTITALSRSPALRGPFAPLLDAAEQMAAEQVRNRATVGGNLASAVPCADLPPILMVLKAGVVLWSPSGERTVALDSFFVGPRRTVRRPGEVLMAVVVPQPPAGFGAAYARFALREGNAIAVAGVAAGLRLDAGDRVAEARIALGAVSPTPVRAGDAEACLAGRPLDAPALDAAAEAARSAADPISDVRGSAAYRREVVGVLTRRALRAAATRAVEGAV